MESPRIDVIIALRNRKGLLRQGRVALSYIIWYSAGRFFIERACARIVCGLVIFCGVSQGLSLLLFVGAIGIWIYRRDYPPKTYYLEGWNLKGERD